VEGIASNAFAQYGALGVLAVSGWVVAYLLWQALKQARLDYAALNERVLTALGNNTQAMTLLAERLRGNAAGAG
jgi:hypothetical protein